MVMNKSVQVEIESMAFKGYGVSRSNGKVLFIPYSVIGDTAWVEIIEEKKRHSFGRLSKLTTPSPWRTDPPCPYFGVCGGCQWQHIDYLIHGELKKGILEEILKRLGGLKEIPPITVSSSPDPYGYRVRVQLKVKGKSMGYYREGSHHVVDINHCQISHALVNQIILSLRREFTFFSQMEEIEINISPEEGKGILILHSCSLPKGWEGFLKDFLRSYPFLKGCAIFRKSGLTLLGDPYLNFILSINRYQGGKKLRLRASPQSFFQVNLKQNEILIQTVLEFSDVKRDERVLDLYAGIGNFTLPLTAEAKEVVAVEESISAVEDARFNIEENRIRNCDFRQGRVENLLEHWVTSKPDLIVLDPPRMGSKWITQQIARLNPKKIVYTSCEPTTFARDLRLLSEIGFRLQRLTLIDMFPQTYHMEIVGLLLQKT